VPRRTAFWLLALAPDVGALIAARIVSGVSAGLVTGTATAALTELAPASAGRRVSLVAPAANMAGLGLGPLVSGLFAQYAPDPTTLVFVVYLAVLAVAALILLLAVGTVTQVALARFSRRRVILAGLSLFVAALGLIVAALAESAMPLFLVGTVAGGVASGAIFLGSVATANRLAPAGRRGQALSAFFVACYAGLIIPVVGVGVLSAFTGTFPAVLTFSVLLAALGLFSISRFVGGAQ
jgi:MFS family permease